MRPFSRPICPTISRKTSPTLPRCPSSAFGIAVRDDSPFKTLEELVAFAKANPKKLKAAVMGIVGTPHMILGVFNRDAKIEITYVPFDGGGEIVTNLLGRSHRLCRGLPASGQIARSGRGKLRILAVCSPKRFPYVSCDSDDGGKGI